MTGQGLRIFIAVDRGVDSHTIQEAFAPGTAVRIVPLAEAADATSVAAQDSADLVVIGCADSADQALDVIAAAHRQRSDRPVVVVHEGSANGFLQRAFEAGADDLIQLPQSPAQLGFAFEKALARKRGTAASLGVAPMVTVLGPKGGTGKTLTSCNLAVALALGGTSSVIVDLDLQFGDVGLALGLHPERTIYDLATSGGTLDGEKVDGFLVQHPSGARALLAPVRPDQQAVVQTAFLRETFEILRSRYDCVVVDTPPAFTPDVIAAVDASSALCVVGMLDALSLKDTKIGLETLKQMGRDANDVTLVLNRADTDVGITEDDVERLLGRSPDVLVPSDRAIPRAITDGRPIVVAQPRSKAARAFFALADRYTTPALTSAPVAAPARAKEQGRRLPLLRRAAES